MKALLIAGLYCFVTVQSAYAQLTTAKIFKKTIQSIRSLKSVQYSMKYTEKNPFSQGDLFLEDQQLRMFYLTLMEQ